MYNNILVLFGVFGVCPLATAVEQDGSRIAEYAVEPRWLTIGLAEGQLVPFSERGRVNPEAATVYVCNLACSSRTSRAGAGSTFSFPAKFHALSSHLPHKSIITCSVRCTDASVISRMMMANEKG